ncbi:MAG: hypothetical protein M1826_003115 [Phylliscum demangeonii]|nr:MAG: hypothetical protein M1826_003115 [Phylliscum demangeonii]
MPFLVLNTPSSQATARASASASASALVRSETAAHPAADTGAGAGRDPNPAIQDDEGPGPAATRDGPQQADDGGRTTRLAATATATATAAMASLRLTQAMPPPPAPDADDDDMDDGDDDDDDAIDIFRLTASAALQMVCRCLAVLVEVMDDVPPTAPGLEAGAWATMRSLQAEKDDTARYYARASTSTPPTSRSRDGSRAGTPPPAPAPASLSSSTASLQPALGGRPQHAHDHLARLRLMVSAGASSPHEIENVQHRALLRRFYSKQTPTIAIGDYVARLHRFCPMSTAVLLAASWYVHRLAVVERVVALTRRLVHRLLLAAVRVAMKALEDLAYPHSRFAKVAGVSALELGRLELSFCFLANFELKVDRETLEGHARWLRRTVHGRGVEHA